MRVRVRRGLRVAVAVAIAMALVLGLATRGGARTADTSTVSIADATGSVVEGQPATFPVTISPAATASFRIDFTSSDSGAGFVDVPAGATSVNATVPTTANSTPEDDRNFTVTLTGLEAVPGDATSDPTTAVLGTTTATGKIIDDDWQIGAIATTPAVPSVPETGGQTIDFQVSLPAPAPATHVISVDYAVADGSAHNGRDFTVTAPAGGATSGTLTFAPGTQSADVQVKAKGDGLFGSDRNFTVTFSNPQGAAFTGGVPNEQVTGTITETDPPPLLGVSACAGGTVNAGGIATFPIVLGASPGTTLPVSVDYTTVDDSTVAGDYAPVSGTATFQVGGQRDFELQVQTNVNPPQGDRKFHVQLSNPQNVRLSTSAASCTIHSTAGGGGGAKGSITITNPPPVTPPATGSTPATVKLNLTLPSPLPSNPGPVAVQWQTQDGTAKAGTDYTASSGTVTWPAGTNGANPTPITIPVNANTSATTPLSFTVAFTSTDATFAGAGTATVTIVQPGSTVPVLSIANASVPKHGGSVPVTVTMAPAASGPVTVDYATADGTSANPAKAGTNYTATSGTLTFAPGTTTKTINVPILANETAEPNRDFTVSLANATGGAVIGSGTATVTILNDVGVKVVPPVLTPTRTPTQKQPAPLPAPQPQNTGTHFVLVQLLTGTSKVDAKGRAPFKIGCPPVAVRACVGTAVFDIGVSKKVGKKTVIKTMHVASGKFSIHVGKTGMFTATLNAAGFKLLKTARRMRVKATFTSHDASGAKGVTAWLATMQAPAPPKPTAKKPVAKKKK